MDGLAASGVAVSRVGLGPTPMPYFAVHVLGTDAGLMFTGSPHPPDHHGLKLVAGCQPFFPDYITVLVDSAGSGAVAPRC